MEMQYPAVQSHFLYDRVRVVSMPTSICSNCILQYLKVVYIGGSKILCPEQWKIVNCFISRHILSLIHGQRWIEEVHEIRVRGKVQVYPFFTATESQKYTKHRPRGYVRVSRRGMLVHLEVLDKENLVTLRCLRLWCIHFSHRMFKFSQELAASWTARQFPEWLTLGQREDSFT